MSQGKPCQPYMSLRENQHMNLDTEQATHTGMKGQSKSSHKYLLLQLWCGLLTVAMVVMAALVATIKPKPTEIEVSTMKPDNVSPTDKMDIAYLKSTGSSFSYIQLSKTLENNSWQALHSCHNCSLFLSNNSIHCTQDGLYFLYAQVTFTRHTSEHQSKYVTLKKNPNLTKGKKLKKLAEGSFPSSTEGSVWVAKIVRLREGDSVSLDIKDEILKESTFWGAYELH
ncbi:lymphotoxin-alpha [Mastacembelus armatus]|uniref:lymphotoxin-alpha n=1 Tax=Mastacembelus armatus TaxID=205130 RepID=UPI000E4638CF|nr:uncharacterized protein LOC113136381 [Mastacembelus armatus]